MSVVGVRDLKFTVFELVPFGEMAEVDAGADLFLKFLTGVFFFVCSPLSSSSSLEESHKLLEMLLSFVLQTESTAYITADNVRRGSKMSLAISWILSFFYIYIYIYIYIRIIILKKDQYITK